MLGGQVQAVTTDNTILAGFAAQPQNRGKLKVVGAFFSNEIYGIGLKKGDSKGVAAVNQALKSMFEDGSWQAALRNSGKYSRTGCRCPSRPSWRIPSSAICGIGIAHILRPRAVTK